MKSLIKILLIGLLAGGAIAYYLWNKPHKDMESATSDFELTAQELFQSFSDDEAAANAKFLGKTITVRGIVKEHSASDGVIKVQLHAGEDALFGISCELDNLTTHRRTTFTAGETVVLKGICAGYNFDVQLNRCVEQ